MNLTTCTMRIRVEMIHENIIYCTHLEFDAMKPQQQSSGAPLS
jgi:hypothetical protein